MLRNLKIPYKFPLLMICFALLSAIVMGIISLRQATTSMEREAEARMISLLESRAATLDRYFYNIQNDLRFHAQSPFVQEAFAEFTLGWDALPDAQTSYLQRHYIDRNPYSYGQEFSLLTADDGSLYSDVHQRFHSPMVNLIRTGGYHDAFLISTEGDILYSVMKERDFATNVIENPNAGLLRNVFETVMQTDVRRARPENEVFFTDFASYGPSDAQVAGFVGMNIYDSESRRIGVLVFQFSIEGVNTIMQVTAGMGETGETYVVGPDKTMRSDSRFLGARSVLATEVDTASVAQAQQGFSGVHVVEDYRNRPVLSAYAPLDVMGVPWVILAEMDQDEILAPVRELTVFLSISGLAVSAAIAVLGYLLASDLSRPIVTMTNVMNRLAKNDLGVNISVDDRTDEIGQMARALSDFKDFAIEGERIKQELSHLAQHDGLTGLPNREFAVGYLAFAVMIADVDGFKHVNDVLGHDVGDQVLKEMSNRFRYLMQGQNIASRLGGDEFLFILPDCETLEDCERIAAKILETSKGSFALSDYKQAIQLSVGVARFPGDATTASELMKAADLAMY
jgi:diguanylate cyclase (GGDEF)-like protein